MTDRVESMQLGVDEVVALRRQLAEANACVTGSNKAIERIERQLAESQARDKVLRDAYKAMAYSEYEVAADEVDADFPLN